MAAFGVTPSTQPSLFGVGTAATTTPAFGGFGTANPTTTTSSFTGFGGFGATTTSASTGFGGFSGFGGTTTTAQTGFGGFSGFGTTTTAPTASTGLPAFGGFQQTGLGATTGTTGLGLNTGTFGLGTTTAPFGAQQQQAQANEAGNLQTVAMAVSLPQIFGDERDAIIAKWNQLQSYWGTGKGYFNQNGQTQSVNFTPDNVFCRFKAVGYSCLSKTRNEDGLVAITINKKHAEVTAQQQHVVDTLYKMFGSKPQLSVCVEVVKPLPENKTELVIYLLERPTSGPAKRVPASDVFNFLSQANVRTQIQTQLCAENMFPKTGLNTDQLKQYLDSPPEGTDPLLWQQAKLDNPDPENLIPVPMIGFKELQKRLRHQDQQTKLHQQRLDLISQDQSELQLKQSDMLAKLEEYRRKHLELGHRLLQVGVKQEIYRKLGYGIQVEEEQLRVQLEAIQTELNHPTQFKGRLNELMSQIRMQNHLAGASRSEINYQMDPSLQQEIKQLLKQQQDGLQHLIEIIKEDSQDLRLIEQNLTSTPYQR